MAQRVVDEVAERLTAAQRVDRRAQVAGDVDLDRAALLAGPVGEAIARTLEQLADRDLLGTHRQPPVVGAGDQQQVLGEVGQVVGLLQRRMQRFAHRRAVAVAHRRLELGLDDGERRAQLVARVGQEAPLALERGLEARQHLVQRLAEAADLVVRLGQRKALGAAAQRDLPGPPAHRLERRARSRSRTRAARRSRRR